MTEALTDSEATRNLVTVFLVDDEPLILKALARQMRQEGYRIKPFSSAAEALDALQTDSPDCIISDYYMPKMDGLDFLGQVEKKHEAVGRILLTGGYIDRRVKQALEEGAVHVLLRKPWRIQVVREALRRVAAGEANVDLSGDQDIHAEVRSAEPLLEEGPKPAVKSGLTDNPRPRIVVVDDEPAICEGIRRSLGNHLYDVQVVSDAMSALDVIRDCPPDLLICDLIMPGHSGFELMDAVRELYPTLPILAISGRQERDGVVKAFHHGATTYLAKPLPLKTLEATVHRCLNFGCHMDERLGSDSALAAVMRLQRATVNNEPIEHLLDILLQELLRIGKADRATVMLMEPDGLHLRIAASYGLDLQEFHNRPVAVNEHISGWVVRQNQPRLIIGDAEEYQSETDENLIERPQVGLCIPMRGEHSITGALCLTKLKCAKPFPAEVLELGLLLSGEVARALEQIQAEDQVQKMSWNTIRQDKLVTLGELASGLAHEINNPLGYVSSNLSTLKEYLGELTPVLRVLSDMDPNELPTALKTAMENLDLPYLVTDLPSCLDETEHGTQRVLQIIRDLKDMARDDLDSREMVDLVQVIEGAVNILWNQIKYKAEVVRDYQELPKVPCYPAQLGQVLLNIIHNAVQAIESEGRIVIRTRLIESDQQVVIDIQDNGAGMAKEVLDRVFEPFYTTKPRGVGTGLGLSIAKKIIHRHHGNIHVSSQPGQGTAFKINLPYGTGSN